MAAWRTRRGPRSSSQGGWQAGRGAAGGGGGAGAGAADALGAEQPLHGGTGEPQALALPEQVGEVVIVRAGIGGARQGKNSGPDGFREAPRGGAAAVPMGQGREALPAQAGQPAAEGAEGEDTNNTE